MDNFFYNMNQKLKDVLDTPKSEHKQLNEGAVAEASYSAKAARAGKDIGKPGKEFAKIAKSAGERYGSKERGEKVAGAVLAKLRGKNESAGDMDESAFQAAIGKKKYGADGMKALQKAGRDHASAKTMSNIRNKYDKYDESMEEGMFDSLKKGMTKVGKAIVGPSDQELLSQLQDRMYPDLKKVGKAAMKPAAKPLPMAKPRTPIAKEEYGPLESAGGTPMTPKQKKFAKLAPPTDKITFADKIAGAKKEVDEMLGDVAAEAMRGALKGGQKKLDRNHNGKLDAQDFAMLRAGKGKQQTDEGDFGPMEEGWDDMIKDVDRRHGEMKKGEKKQGHKGEIEKTDTGIKHTRRYDDKTGETDTGDDDTPKGEKRRGRPKGTGKAMGAKGPSGKSKLITKGHDAPSKKAKKEGEELDEKAVSQQQQKFMGMVHAMQKGEKVKGASPELKKVAKTMKKKDAEDFAATKHKGLPKKVKDGKAVKEEDTGDTPKATTSGKGMTFGKGIYDSLNREIENLIAESMSMNASDSTDGTKSLTITATDDDAIKLAAMLKAAGVGGAGHEEPHGEVEVIGVDSPISGDEGHEHGKEPCETCGSADCGCGDIDEALAENEPDWPTDTETSDDAFQYSGGLNKPKATGQTTVPVIAHQDSRMGVDGDKELRRMMEMAGLQSELKPWERTMKEDAEEELDEAKEEELDEAKDEELDESKCNECGMYESKCKCSESVEESLAAIRNLAGLKEAAKPDYIDLDKDGDRKESMKKAADDAEKDKKVEESIFKMTNLWKAYRG